MMQIGGNIAAAKAVYDDAPGVYLLLGALAIGSSAFAYWKYEFGGYKGIYSPVDMLEALNREENVFLVDIRPEEDLKEKGVLDLKRRARGKATHLPVVDVGPDYHLTTVYMFVKTAIFLLLLCACMCACFTKAIWLSPQHLLWSNLGMDEMIVVCRYQMQLKEMLITVSVCSCS